MLRVVFASVLVSLIAAQSCPATAGTGSCSATLTCPTGDQCTNIGLATQTCCPAAQVIPAATTASSVCVDKLNLSTGVSDCTKMASYCNNAVYYTLMTQQCPRTCGRCSGTATTASSTCVDKINPSTGVSDCTKMASFCNNSVYYTLMTQECPRTCGRCTTG